LKSSALVSQFPDSVKDEINNLLSNSIMTTGIVVGCILLASDELFRVEELTVGTSANLIFENEKKNNLLFWILRECI